MKGGYYHPISLNGGKKGSSIEASFNMLLSRFEWAEEDRHEIPKPLKARAFEPGDTIAT